LSSCSCDATDMRRIESIAGIKESEKMRIVLRVQMFGVLDLTSTL
jgi:hypothetical protein